jgi:transcription-repair coupling factor (superfamily II helicase)
MMISQAAVYEYLTNEEARALIVCDNDEEAARIGDTARLAGYEACVLPDIRVSAGEDLRPYGGEIAELLEALERFYTAEAQGKRP